MNLVLRRESRWFPQNIFGKAASQWILLGPPLHVLQAEVDSFIVQSDILRIMSFCNAWFGLQVGLWGGSPRAKVVCLSAGFYGVAGVLSVFSVGHFCSLSSLLVARTWLFLVACRIGIRSISLSLSLHITHLYHVR